MLENKNNFKVIEASSSKNFANVTEYLVIYHDGYDYKIGRFFISDSTKTKDEIIKGLSNLIKESIENEKEFREKMNKMDILRKSIIGEYTL